MNIIYTNKNSHAIWPRRNPQKSIANVIEAKYQCALMGPTEILAQQHYNLALKIFKGTNFRIEFLSGNPSPKSVDKFTLNEDIMIVKYVIPYN